MIDNSDYDGLNKQFKEIKSLPSHSKADDFETKSKTDKTSVSFETLHLPNIEANEEAKNNSTQQISTLNMPFNKLSISNRSNEEPKT